MRTTASITAALALCGTALAGASPARGSSSSDDPNTDFVRLGPPGPDSWRRNFPEPEQSFEEYRKETHRSLDFEARRIVLLPLGAEREGDEALLDELAAFLGAYFMTRVEIEKRREVPEEVPCRSMRGYGRQLLADTLIKIFSRGIQREAVARLAVTSDDLYATAPSGAYLNFVFGLGSYPRRTAVCSKARFSMHYRGEPKGVTARKRLFKLSAHELAHVFGLAHCQTYRCLMNGTNSLREADTRPMHLCPECLEKLTHHFGFDPALRYRIIEETYRKLGWKAEADFAARRALVAARRAAGRTASPQSSQRTQSAARRPPEELPSAASAPSAVNAVVPRPGRGEDADRPEGDERRGERR